MSDKKLQYLGVAAAAVVFTLMAAFHGVLAENLVHVVEHWAHGHIGVVIIVSMIGFAALTATFWNREYFERFLSKSEVADYHQKPKAHVSFSHVAALIVFTGMAAAHGLLSINFAHWVEEHWALSHGARIGIAGACFFVGTIFIWWIKDKLFTISTTQVHECDQTQAHAAIIMTLSTENPNLPDAERFAAAKALFNRKLGKVATAESWQAAIDALTSSTPEDPLLTGWNIQQPLRALKMLIGLSTVDLPLSQIKIFCSEKSLPRYKEFAKLVRLALQSHPASYVRAVKLTRHRQLLVESKLQQNYDMFKSVLNNLQKVNPGRTVSVDITGGTADFSVAGALATVSRKVQFSYINTNDGKNIDFDVQAFAAGISAE